MSTTNPTSRPATHALSRVLGLMLLLAPAASAQDGLPSGGFALTCDADKEAGRLVLTVPSGTPVRGRELPGGDYAIEVRSADLGELSGRVRCRGRVSVRAVPGRLLGALTSRLVVDLPEGADPRLTVGLGEAELTWGPEPAPPPSPTEPGLPDAVAATEPDTRVGEEPHSDTVAADARTASGSMATREPNVTAQEARDTASAEPDDLGTDDSVEMPTDDSVEMPTDDRGEAWTAERGEVPVADRGAGSASSEMTEPPDSGAEALRAEVGALRALVEEQRRETERLRREVARQRARADALAAAPADAPTDAPSDATAPATTPVRSGPASGRSMSTAPSNVPVRGGSDVDDEAVVGAPVGGSSALTLRPRRAEPVRSTRPLGRGAASDGVVRGVATGAQSPPTSVQTSATEAATRPAGPPTRPPLSATTEPADASTGTGPSPQSASRAEAAAASRTRPTRAPAPAGAVAPARAEPAGAPAAATRRPPQRPAEPAPVAEAPPDLFQAFDRPIPVTAGIEADLRTGPGRRHERVRRVARGETLVAEGRLGDWLRTGDGWVFAAFFAPGESMPGASTARTASVVAITAPVHAGPGGQHRVVSEVVQGETVVVDEVLGEWAHVRGGGWVRRSGLAFESP